MKPSVPQVEIAIVAPSPIGLDVNDGWADRISVVDRIFKDHRRLYLNFASHHRAEPSIVQQEALVFEARLNPTTRKHKEFVDSVVREVRAVYVHTVHWAEHVLDWLASGK